MFFLFLSSSFSANDVYTTCNSTSCDQNVRNTQSFKIGYRIAVDAIFTGYSGNETNPEVVKRYMRFYPEVDKLALLQFQDVNCLLTNLTNSTLQLKVGNFTTNLWAYRPLSNPDLVTEYFSAQIQMEKGIVTGIFFDDLFDENSCKGERLPYRCAVRRPTTDECTNQEMIKTFLAFIGTDSDETPFESRQLLPSTFLKYGMRGVIDDAVSLFNTASDWITDLFN